MGSALEKAIELILSGNAELADILLVTARMTLPSSLIALAIGVPLGVLLGSCVFPGRRFLTVLNRTMTGYCMNVFYEMGLDEFDLYKVRGGETISQMVDRKYPDLDQETRA